MSLVKTQCPICGKVSVEAVKPFCSSRCATLDLGQWLGEGYRLPTTESDEEASLEEGESL